jgi:hypothetical protein
MRAFTESDFVFVGSVRPADNDVAATIEGADGSFSIDASRYEDIVAIATLYNNVAGAKSVSIQFYESAAPTLDVSATWTAVGAPVVVDLGTGTVGSVGVAVKNRQAFTKKYVSAIAVFTLIDPGVGVTTTAQLLLQGRIKDRV